MPAKRSSAALLATLFVAVGALSRPATAINEADARYLMGRVAFGASPSDVERLAPLTWEQAVESVLGQARTEPTTTPDGSFFETVDLAPAFTPEERKAHRQRNKQAAQTLKAWWLSEMVRTPGLAGERMTLFWHNLFTSSFQKVRQPGLLYRQNLMLRRHALGNFRTLLSEVLKDPAMLLYLDNQQNKKQHADENLGRELLELFTLGEGHYTEQDVKEVARSLTGLIVRRRVSETRFARRLHDHDDKTIFGRTGNFASEDLVDLNLARPEAATFLSEKLWRTFISDTPDPVEVSRLAAVLRDGGWEIRPWLRVALNSSVFRHPSNRRRLIKSPVELPVGSLRALELLPPEGTLLVKVAARMGQDVFDPPNVRGCPGGARWVASARLLARRQLLTRVAEEAAGQGRGARLGDPRRLLVRPPVSSLANDPARRLHDVLLDPVWQLK